MTSTKRLARACRVGLLLLPGLLSAGLVGGCGKKGPPLAPIVPTPAAIADLAPRRLGDSVQVRFTVPAANLDGTTPANLDRIEVYGFTGLLPSDVREMKDATLVGTVQVQRHVTAEEREEWEKKGLEPPPNPGVPAGAVANVTEVLTAESLVPVVPKKPKKVVVPPVDPVEVFHPLVGPVPDVRPVRFYVARGISRKKVKGPLSIRPSLSLEAPPTPPLDVRAEYSEKAVTLSWLPPAEQRKPIQEPFVAGTMVTLPPPPDSNTRLVAAAIARSWVVPADAGTSMSMPGVAALFVVPSVEPAEPSAEPVEPLAEPVPTAAPAPPLEHSAAFLTTAVSRLLARAPAEAPVPDPIAREILPATPKGVATSVVFTYNVYLAVDPSAPPPVPAAGTDPPAVPAAPVDPLQPLNAAPLADLTFDDPAFETGTPRCYVVRAVDKGVESEPTPMVCVTPLDVFPPAAPTALAAIGSEGAISLIWEGVTAPDLAGYVVMRGDGPDAPLLPLFDEPIRETSFRDATAKPGVRYTYAVVAVDTAVRRNVSLPSNRAEEAAR